MPLTPFAIAGVDEVGRGPLAGPVTAAAVLLDPHRPVDGLTDSKALTAVERERLARAIRRRALGVGLGEASVQEIDALNILHASHLAMRRALAALGAELAAAAVAPPALVVIDGDRTAGAGGAPEVAIVGGDARVAAVAAASIVAKVARDALMVRLHDDWPAYGFDGHKGYPTRAHREALVAHGACPWHRRSFAPVRKALAARSAAAVSADGSALAAPADAPTNGASA